MWEGIYFVTFMTVLLQMTANHKQREMMASLLHQLAHTIMLRCNIDQWPNFPSPFHAPTFQSTFLYTLHHFSNPQTIWKYNALFQEVCKKKVLYTGSNFPAKASRPLSPSPLTICSKIFSRSRWEIPPSSCLLLDIGIFSLIFLMKYTHNR